MQGQRFNNNFLNFKYMLKFNITYFMQCIKAIDYDFVRPPIIFRCNGLEFKTACGYKSS